MRDLPSGRELATLAEQERQRLDTLTPEERALTLAMIARARAIAEREAAAGDAGLSGIRATLQRLYGEGDADVQFRRLAEDIRAGSCDSGTADHEAVRLLLWELTLQKLRESNPSFLSAHGLE